MALFALSDVHLGQAMGKTMDRFGPLWQNHQEKLYTGWLETVGQEDTVLMPGDLSWAMRWPDFLPDLAWLATLPGHKIISRGNHDYYWQSKAKMRSVLPPGFEALDRSYTLCEGYAVVAIKGWMTPETLSYEAEADEKYYLRERGRLEASLAEASSHGLPIIVQMHYPPLAHAEETGFSDILEAHGVALCLYGHLHSGNWEHRIEGRLRGVTYQLVSADYLGFRPLALAPLLV